MTRASVSVPGLTLTAAARTGVFWVLALAFLASNFTTNTVTVHLIPYPSDRGYSATLAAAMIGWMGAMQLPARLVFGPVVACFRHRIVTVAIFFFQAASLAQLAMVRRLPTLAPMVVMLGVANGMATLARATTTAEIFGPRHYWSISGAIALGANGARAVAVRRLAPARGARRLRARVLAPGRRAGGRGAPPARRPRAGSCRMR